MGCPMTAAAAPATPHRGCPAWSDDKRFRCRSPRLPVRAGLFRASAPPSVPFDAAEGQSIGTYDNCCRGIAFSDDTTSRKRAL
jgi:hypothetical protein